MDYLTEKFGMFEDMADRVDKVGEVDMWGKKDKEEVDRRNKVDMVNKFDMSEKVDKADLSDMWGKKDKAEMADMDEVDK